MGKHLDDDLGRGSWIRRRKMCAPGLKLEESEDGEEDVVK